MSDKKTEVVTFEQATALTGNKAIAFFSDAENIMPLVEQVKKEAFSLVPDLKTKKGRDAIGTNASNISKSRGLLEDLIDKSVSVMDAKVKKAKAVKKVVISELKEARETVLAPRKAWQLEKDKIEEKRIEAIKEKIAGICNLGLFNLTDTKEVLSNKIDALENIDVSDSFEEFTAEAAKAVSEAISALNARILSIIEDKKQEAQRVQLLAEQKKTKIQERLSNLVQIPLGLMGKDSLLIQKKINSMEALEVKEEDFEERYQEAVTSSDQVVSQLKMMFTQAEQLEVMQAQQQKESDHALAIEEDHQIEYSKKFVPTPIHEQKVSASQQEPQPVVEQVIQQTVPESQYQKRTNAIEVRSQPSSLPVDFHAWSRKHLISLEALTELEALIVQMYRFK